MFRRLQRFRRVACSFFFFSIERQSADSALRVVPDDQAVRLMEVLIGWTRTQMLVQGYPCVTEGPVVH